VKGFKQIEDINTKYEMGKQLDKGNFGTVFSAKHKATDQLRAIKIVHKKKIDQNKAIMLKLIKDELTLLEKTDHPNITRVFELMEDN